ncbi:MAG: hypothetical protein ACK5NF_06340 [Bacilli bacterium]
MNFGLKMNGGDEMLTIIVNIMSLVIISSLVQNKSKACTFLFLVLFYSLVATGYASTFPFLIFILLYILYMIL